MKIINDIIYSDITERGKLDIYLPDSDNFTVFIYFHGGGIESGDKGDAAYFAEYLTKRNIAVASANYRIYPSAKSPEFLEDSAKACAWVCRNISKYGKCSDVFVGGSSAGGYISQMLCFDEKYLRNAGVSADEISGYVMDAGQPTTHFNVLRERGLDSRRVVVDEAAPLYYIRGNADYAPMYIIVADNDIACRYEQTMLLVSTLRNFNCNMDKVTLRVMKNSAHCEYNTAVDENGDNVLGKLICKFIEKYKK